MPRTISDLMEGIICKHLDRPLKTALKRDSSAGSYGMRFRI